MKLTRRTFIMASGAAAGWVVAGCAATPDGAPVTSALTPRKAKPASPAQGDWVASTCQGCTQWCAIQIFVQDGRAVRVRGNPLSKTNHGYVCPRGHLIPQQVYDPDRIKQPMKRTNPEKGIGVDPGWKEITWDEAMAISVEALKKVRAKDPRGLILSHFDIAGYRVSGAFGRAFGTVNMHWNRADYCGSASHPALFPQSSPET